MDPLRASDEEDEAKEKSSSGGPGRRSIENIQSTVPVDHPPAAAVHSPVAAGRARDLGVPGDEGRNQGEYGGDDTPWRRGVR
jgi:hypothetical protein